MLGLDSEPVLTSVFSDSETQRAGRGFLLVLIHNLQIRSPVMSDCDASCQFYPQVSEETHLCEGCEGLEDDSRKLKRREKNRVSARRSRKRQTLRADLLHQTCELLEQKNRKLRREVDSLSEEQRELNDALKAHEPFCPIMHCSFTPSSMCSLQPDSRETHSV